MSQILGVKSFMLPGMRNYVPEAGRTAAEPLFSQPSRCSSRREWLKTAGIGAAGLLALGTMTQRSEAILVQIACGIVHAIVGLARIAFHVAAIPIVAAVHAAKWVLFAPICHNHCDHYHYTYASPYVPDRVIAPVQSDVYPGTYFEMNRFGRLAGENNFTQYQDLNTPEFLRVQHEIPEGGLYRPVRHAIAARRQLTQRDRDLFWATFDTYRQNGYAPTANTITPVYAREMADARGVVHTGFGLETRDGGKNFLIATESSWRA